MSEYLSSSARNLQAAGVEGVTADRPRCTNLDLLHETPSAKFTTRPPTRPKRLGSRLASKHQGPRLKNAGRIDRHRLYPECWVSAGKTSKRFRPGRDSRMAEIENQTSKREEIEMAKSTKDGGRAC